MAFKRNPSAGLWLWQKDKAQLLATIEQNQKFARQIQIGSFLNFTGYLQESALQIKALYERLSAMEGIPNTSQKKRETNHIIKKLENNFSNNLGQYPHFLDDIMLSYVQIIQKESIHREQFKN